MNVKILPVLVCLIFPASLYAQDFPDYSPPSFVFQGPLDQSIYKLSVLIVAKKDVPPPVVATAEKTMSYSILKSKYITGWTLYRFSLTIPWTGQNITVGDKTFTIPSLANRLSIFYTSCNDNQKGVEDNWKMFRAFAEKNNACLHIQGGDNIPYPDNGLDEIFNHDWKQALTQDHKKKVKQLYLRLYLQAFQWLKTEGTVYPQINERDDHDFYDGFGSLSQESETSPIALHIRDVAEEMYLLFQHHIMPEEKTQAGFFGGSAHNFSRVYTHLK